MSKLTRDQVMDLCFVIHNAQSEEERNSAKVELAYSYEEEVTQLCLKKLQEMYNGNFIKNEANEEKLERLKEVCFDTLIERTERYSPEHPSHASLMTYADRWLKYAIKMETNRGMTEAQVKNISKIHNAQKYFEEIYDTEWYESEENLIELSNLSGFSVKVIKRTLELKRESVNMNTVSLFAPVGEDGLTRADLLEDTCNTPDRELKTKSCRAFLNSLNKEETAILYTMVDVDNNYKPISEREGIRLLEAQGFSIQRGTLNNRRKALKRKVRAFLDKMDVLCDYDNAA